MVAAVVVAAAVVDFAVVVVVAVVGYVVAVVVGFVAVLVALVASYPRVVRLLGHLHSLKMRNKLRFIFYSFLQNPNDDNHRYTLPMVVT